MLVATLLFIMFPLSIAHSWVERLLRIARNGTMIGPEGYIRVFSPRTPTLNQADNFNLIPPNGRPDAKVIHPDDLICKSMQTIANYSGQYTMLSAAPGDLVALQYQENGHVTLPLTSKPENRGTIYVYGTEKPSNTDTALGIHNTWTHDGQGGDKRGRLSATRDFDDGQCYQINSGPISHARQSEFSKNAEDPQGADIWCQADIQLPGNISGGIYTLYWVWDLPTLSNTANGERYVTIPEIYTSCFLIVV
ncbi:hypothetical protein F5883DRAFT_609257 [Diaporthe sp. PMI_573]|nr:hypothetical protein F5883DRAFT_609257 [Diaporthaceae sp. PMI_573]